MHTEVIIALVSICGQEDLNIANSLGTKLSGRSFSHFNVFSQSSRVCARRFVTKERAHNAERFGIVPVDGKERVEKADAVEMVDPKLTLSSSFSAPNAVIPPFCRFWSR